MGNVKAADGLKTLRAEFAAYCRPAANQNTPPLQKISMIGAIPDSTSIISDNDHLYLATTFLRLNHHGIAVSPEFDLDIINIHPDFGGRNFHEETQQTDLAIFCMIFNPPEYQKTSFNKDLHLQGIFAISAQHHNRDVWHDSALRVGAKILSVFGGYHTEINGNHFRRFNDPQFDVFDQGEVSWEATLLKHTSYELPPKAQKQPGATPPYPGR